MGLKTRHRHTVGQLIELVPSRLAPKGRAGLYEVTRLMPNDGPDPEYRVKRRQDGQEQVVQESQLRLAPEGTA
ncbi:hypothetical protein IAI18_11925 [Acetobacteraceae bacterium H6797]|nr:hypothetical protein [Acetobacteraceae bacterium H6797]